MDSSSGGPWHEYAALLKDITSEWDRAEQDIKLAEQVNNKVVLPSIKELRYAGRRLVEVIKLVGEGAPISEIQPRLQDAKLDCHRARHDAIDAATANIAANLDIMAKKLGYNSILKIYPEFGQLHRDLSYIRSKIAESRGNTNRREEIYVDLEDDAFPKLIAKYHDLQAGEPIIKSLAKSERRKAVIVSGLGILNALLASALIAGLGWVLTHWKIALGWAANLK